MYQQQFLNRRSRFLHHISIYTNWFKVDNRVSVVLVAGQHHHGVHISGQSSVFTAEACTLLLSLEYVENAQHNVLYQF